MVANTKVKDYFGSMHAIMVSLWAAVSGGNESWNMVQHERAEPICGQPTVKVHSEQVLVSFSGCHRQLPKVWRNTPCSFLVSYLSVCQILQIPLINLCFVTWIGSIALAKFDSRPCIYNDSCWAKISSGHLAPLNSSRLQTEDWMIYGEALQVMEPFQHEDQPGHSLGAGCENCRIGAPWSPS